MVCSHWATPITRVATARGKQGIWKSLFPDREKTGNFVKKKKKKLKMCFYTGNLPPTPGKFESWKKKKNLISWNYPLAMFCQHLGPWTFGCYFVNSYWDCWSEPMQALVVHFGQERVAIWMVAGSQIKGFFNLAKKNTGKMVRAQGKHREFDLDWSVTTLITRLIPRPIPRPITSVPNSMGINVVIGLGVVWIPSHNPIQAIYYLSRYRYRSRAVWTHHKGEDGCTTPVNKKCLHVFDMLHDAFLW